MTEDRAQTQNKCWKKSVWTCLQMMRKGLRSPAPQPCLHTGVLHGVKRTLPARDEEL